MPFNLKRNRQKNQRWKNPSAKTNWLDWRQWQFDYWLLIVTAVMVGIGLIIVYDASVIHAYRDFGEKYHYLKQQSIWVVLGSIALLVSSLFPYRNYKALAWPMFGMSLALILAVFIPGLSVAGGGAHRWLDLGIITIQPAEIIKLTTIILLAMLFEKGARVQPFALIVGGVVMIIGVFQRDLGTAIVYFLSNLAVLVMAGVPLRLFWTLIPVGLAGFLMLVASSTYRQRRILAFLDPFSDPQGYTYHISQILIALGTGSWFGLGLGQSRQKFEFIPEVTTDSIFAIVGEEFGFFGSIILICLIAFLVYRGLSVAERCTDKFGKLLAFGLTAWLGTQAAINLASMVSLIPLTGVPLPFISYGGSALLANMVAIGILLNISKSQK